jgi:hypothetical protein
MIKMFLSVILIIVVIIIVYKLYESNDTDQNINKTTYKPSNLSTYKPKSN